MRGKPVRVVSTLSEYSDHPRRCGENDFFLFHHFTCTGSPPQVRGKHAWELPIFASDRITPAGAGKTEIPTGSTFITEDHPRRCGENLTALLCTRTSAGSPPQVRGKLQEEDSLNDDKRITPAGAGKTLKRSFRNQPFCS